MNDESGQGEGKQEACINVYFVPAYYVSYRA